MHGAYLLFSPPTICVVHQICYMQRIRPPETIINHERTHPKENTPSISYNPCNQGWLYYPSYLLDLSSTSPIRRWGTSASRPDLHNKLFLVNLSHGILRDIVHSHHNLGDLVWHKSLLHRFAHIKRRPWLSVLAASLPFRGENNDGTDLLTPFLRRYSYDCDFFDLGSAYIR